MSGERTKPTPMKLDLEMIEEIIKLVISKTARLT